MKIGNLEVYGVIYKVTNKINNKVYIGQTVQGFRRRYHRKGNNSVEKLYNSTENEHLKYSIRKYGIDNFYINECFDVAFSLKELNIKEELWIKHYNSTNRDKGYNIMNGGDNRRMPQSQKDKLSKIKKEQYLSGKISLMSKEVICLNNLEIFNSMKEACEKYNCNINQMVRCCKHNGISCGKYNNEPLLWMYYKEYENSNITEEYILSQIEYAKNPTSGKNNYNFGKHLSEETINKIKLTKKKNKSSLGENNPMYGRKGYDNPNSKKIVCVTTKEVFANAQEAGKYYNCDSSGITKCCKGKRKTCGGYHWMYYDECLKIKVS